MRLLMGCFIAAFLLLLPGRALAQGSTAINITFHDNNIYNNGHLIGGYKLDTMEDLMSVVVYSSGHTRIAEATHAPDEPSWTVVTPVDQKKMQAPWTQKDGMILLFKFLMEQKYL